MRMRQRSTKSTCITGQGVQMQQRLKITYYLLLISEKVLWAGK